MSKVIDGIVGHAIGDALGIPVEFKNRKLFYSDPVKGMKMSHPSGMAVWSDDTAMEVATIDSYINCNGWDYDDIMKNFCDWLNNAKYTASGETFDVGRTCLAAIRRYYDGQTSALESGLEGMNANGNGSLMRILPVALYCFYKKANKKEILELTSNISSLTHRHEVSILGCYIYVLFVIYLLDGKDMFKAYELIKNEDYSMFDKASVDLYNRVLKDEIYKLEEDSIKSTGYVVDSLEAALWCLLNTDNYKDSVLTAVNLGGDTDTIAAITGSMSGIIYGMKTIPKQWINKIMNFDYLIDLGKKFESAIK